MGGGWRVVAGGWLVSEGCVGDGVWKMDGWKVLGGVGGWWVDDRE